MDRRMRALVTTAVATGAVAAAMACGSNDDPPANDRTGVQPEAGGVNTGWNLVFEESFASGFGGFTQSKSGSGELSTVDGSVSARTGDAPGKAYLRWQPPSAISYEALRVEVAVMPVKLGSPFSCIMQLTPGDVALPSIRLEVPPSGEHAIAHEGVDGGDLDGGDAARGAHAFAGEIPVDRWSTVSVEITFGAAGRARVLYDDVEVLDVSLDEPLPKLDRPEIGIGLACDETNAEMFFDELAIYAR